MRTKHNRPTFLNVLRSDEAKQELLGIAHKQYAYCAKKKNIGLFRKKNTMPKMKHEPYLCCCFVASNNITPNKFC